MPIGTPVPMDPSLRERLGFRPPSGPQGRERAERALAARSLMYVFAVGALIAGAALVSPGAHPAETRIAVTAACAAAVAGVLLIGYDRLPHWALSVLLLCA